MSYPQAPWTLQGYAVISLHLLNIDRVRHLIPSELEIIPVWPSKTVGGVYLSYYGSESELEYSELIVVPAFVGYRGTVGGWVSHIYVDNPDSVAGGREIWGLPKELAEFTWEKDNSVIVRQGSQILCSLKYHQPLFAWRQWLGSSSFSAKNSELLTFMAEIESNLGLINSKLEVPAQSPFANIGLGQPLLSVHCDRMSLRVRSPEVVGQTTVAYS
ncbi:MAG: acetoacetate decarboxylase family protein [Chlorogloeopsis fritschii C42_A2020_084]|uniref:acetoacetate decarboxylase family protein n=1 Tax=Chlorogloeopsis fritschii TaxID=1124 RepID=UPI0019E01690|nr:acetoacetate decarboxylase family protein [Chlorogloeopsis fritschii]MBF2005925.1 acetoacetate decarboxylase family protein [Chlorogloeopsis fritschii C42_A2020_084]